MIELVNKQSHGETTSATVKYDQTTVDLQTREHGVLVSWFDRQGEERLMSLIELVGKASTVHAVLYGTDTRLIRKRRKYLSRAPVLASGHNTEGGIVRMDVQDDAYTVTVEQKTIDAEIEVSVFAEDWEQAGNVARSLQALEVSGALPQLVAAAELEY